MAEEKFEVGDLVQLKSGGPIMTVRHSYGNRVYTVWFQDHIVNEGEFAPATLKKSEKVGKCK